MSGFNKEQVLSVHHWTDQLFSFSTTRDPGFRFQNGQFTMMGLEVDGRPLLRAYSMASANHGEPLEFFSIIKDPEVYERYDDIVLVHGCRQISELTYGERVVEGLRGDEFLGPLLEDKLRYYPTVTREPFRNRGRITDLITSEQLFNDLHQPPLDIATDRIMMCGSPAMLEELRQLFESRGFLEGNNSQPGH